MKKVFVVLAILFIGILLAGCTTSQPATPTPTATATEVPTTVAPAETPTAVPTTEVVVVVVNQTPTAAPTPTPTPQPAVIITFTSDLTVKPSADATIPAGGKVIWVNADPFKPHAVKAINVQTGNYFGSMDTILIPYGGSFNVTFDKAGAYDYKTVFQPDKIGKIVVTK